MKNGKTTPMCVKCGETDTTKISTSKRFKNGYRSQCKACDKAHYEANKEARLLKCKEYRDTKLDKVKAAAYSKQYREDNHEACRLSSNLSSQLRNAKKRDQTPELTINELSKLEILYKISYKVSKYTGIKMHVDHIIPLSKGGLHHPINLQILTGAENLAKGASMPANIQQDNKDLHNEYYGEIRYE